jgi:HEAT repeat protein
MGIAGGPVDTGYVQEVIMGCVCTWAQKDDERASIRTALKTEAASISDPAMQDRLAVMLGYSGDHSVVSTLVRILESEPAGVVRHSAALALDRLSDPASIPALKQALRDDTYARVRSGGCIGPRYSGAQACYSPVRAAAAQALRRMGQSVAADAELVDAKYVVPRLTPLLESSAQPFEALAWLAGLGPDGQKAIEAFIAAEKATPSDAKVVEFAQAVLVLARSRQTQEPQQAPTIAAGN